MAHALYALIAGPAMLSWGLLELKKKRHLENIPVSKVRSAALGLVALSGNSMPREELKAPASELPACWWRCAVEELKGEKNSRWCVIREVDSKQLFYLEDDTGRVTVDARGAELHVEERIIPVDVSDARLQTLVGSWGVSSFGWLGGRRLRVREWAVHPYAPLYAVGELARVSPIAATAKARLAARIEAAKKDPQRGAETGLKPDGSYDLQAWDEFRRREEARFWEDERAMEERVPEEDRLVLRKGADHRMLLDDTESGSEMARLFGWRSLVGILGGIAVSAFGAHAALSRGFSHATTAEMALGGFVLGVAIVLFKERQRRNSWDWLAW